MTKSWKDEFVENRLQEPHIKNSRGYYIDGTFFIIDKTSDPDAVTIKWGTADSDECLRDKNHPSIVIQGIVSCDQQGRLTHVYEGLDDNPHQTDNSVSDKTFKALVEYKNQIADKARKNEKRVLSPLAGTTLNPFGLPSYRPS